MTGDFEKNVFVNCPFDDQYLSLLRPLLFTILFIGYKPRIATERSDSLESRLSKITGLIRNSRYSIHDLSRMRSASVGEFYRMNMPFELGVEYGGRVFGQGEMAMKRCLVLEKEKHQFRKAISDLSGIDVKPHGGDPLELVRAVRNWFHATVGERDVESPTMIWYAFQDFAEDFYDQRKAEGYSDDDLNMMPVTEYIEFIAGWLGQYRSGETS